VHALVQRHARELQVHAHIQRPVARQAHSPAGGPGRDEGPWTQPARRRNHRRGELPGRVARGAGGGPLRAAGAVSVQHWVPRLPAAGGAAPRTHPTWKLLMGGRAKRDAGWVSWSSSWSMEQPACCSHACTSGAGTWNRPARAACASKAGLPACTAGCRLSCWGAEPKQPSGLPARRPRTGWGQARGRAAPATCIDLHARRRGEGGSVAPPSTASCGSELPSRVERTHRSHASYP